MLGPVDSGIGGTSGATGAEGGVANSTGSSSDASDSPECVESPAVASGDTVVAGNAISFPCSTTTTWSPTLAATMRYTLRRIGNTLLIKRAVGFGSLHVLRGDRRVFQCQLNQRRIGKLQAKKDGARLAPVVSGLLTSATAEKRMT